VANFTVRYKIQLTDVNGDTATVTATSVNADTATLAGLNSTATTLAGDIGACSNAKVTSVLADVLFLKAHISAGTAPPPADAVYPSVTDGAHLFFNNSAGEGRSITVPAPLESDFIAGTNTVDPADTNVAALITTMESLSDFSGATNLYQGGVKTAHHARRRATRKHL
jgi:hypothetical protein